MVIRELKTVAPQVLKDINQLLAQLHKDHPRRGSMADLRTIVKSKQQKMLIIEDVGKIIGTALLIIVHKMGNRVGHVEDVVVDETYRGQGLGEKLMQKVISTARTNKLKSLHLTSRSERIAANKLYQKLGFQMRDTNVYKMDLS